MTNTPSTTDLPDDDRQRVRARYAEIAGAGPRITPLEISALSDELADMLKQMIGINAAVASRDKEMLTDIMEPGAGAAAADMPALLAALPEIIRTMIRHPALFMRQTEIGIQLLAHGLLPARERELAILRIGWLCRAPYEWGEHVLIAHKVGLTSEEIERITIGSTAPGWSEHDRAILQAVEELHAHAMIGDATWAILAKRFDDRQLIELPMLIGQYQSVAYYQNALRLRLHSGNRGLEAR